jgi:hypothetical protein
MDKIAKAAKLLRDTAAEHNPDKMAEVIFKMDTDVYIKAHEYNKKVLENEKNLRIQR